MEDRRLGILHCTLATRDVERTSVFFAATLGWRPIDRPRNIPMAVAWLEIAPGQELHLVEVPDFEASRFDREYGRHLAFSYPRDGFTGLKERPVRHGSELIVPQRATGFERFFFRDPNGYVFEVVEAGGP